uniref:Solute:Na+ symporter, SSS family n=1 Tax=Candidatus Kentrum sp. UNK TaxID=2126344 RepID=A0A451APZ3_9GAMM|nr:MAG: solute:Na+ symporter, SSS family [Candidatus Kentron sp. UNK]VFK73414.1 MAG: solute:Na+ symporter, SSS family [Candidatus Kentron sp. UNK]
MFESRLEILDLAMVALYLVFIVGLGFYFSRRMKTSDDYFLAGRSLTWPLIGLSLLASNMSSSSLIGLAGEAYADGHGIAVYNYEWMATIVLVVFVVFFFPLYLRSPRVFTMPEFLERRFDDRSRYYFSGITIVGNILIDTAAALYAGSLVIQIIYPAVSIWASMMVLAILAGLYTMAGGLRAVVYTDAIQAVLLLVGAVIITVLAFLEIGSWTDVTAVTPPEMLSLIRPMDDPTLPWPGLIGVFLLGFYFWGNNQFMVQRVLGARDLDHGRWGAIFAGFLKLPLIFIMVLPGIFAYEIYGSTAIEKPDMVFPTMMLDLLPAGIRGIILVAFIAALMSSIDSTLNSASTLVTMDFVKKLRPAASEKTLVWSGRLTTGIFMVLAAMWAQVIVNFDTLWQYLQSVLAYVSPPIVACFIMGVFWKRANRHGAFSALIVGHLAALLIFILKDYLCVVEFHHLYIPPILVTLCILVIIAVSLASEEPDPDHISPYVWTPKLYRSETDHLAGLSWYQNYRILSIILLTSTAVLVGMFW